MTREDEQDADGPPSVYDGNVGDPPAVLRTAHYGHGSAGLSTARFTPDWWRHSHRFAPESTSALAGSPARRPGHLGGSTTRGLAFQLKPLNIASCLPLPRSPPEQFSNLLMQLSVHIFMAVSSQAPNQSL